MKKRKKNRNSERQRKTTRHEDQQARDEHVPHDGDDDKTENKARAATTECV